MIFAHARPAQQLAYPLVDDNQVGIPDSSPLTRGLTSSTLASVQHAMHPTPKMLKSGD